jgi:hypothetical protein
MQKKRGGARRLAGHSNWPETQQRGRKEQAALIAPTNSRKGKMKKEGKEEGKREGEGERGCSRPRRS